MKINLAEAKQQYFKLLRRSHRVSNDSKNNQLYFYVDLVQSKQRLYVEISPQQKLLLCVTNRFDWWVPQLPLDFEELSRFAAYFANSNPYTYDFSNQLISNLFRFQDE